MSGMDWGAALARAENERDEVAGRLSELLCDLTGGRLSKPGYDVATMAQAVEEHFERTVVAVAWQEGYEAARGMARCYGHTDHWEGAPENPYRPEVQG